MILLLYNKLRFYIRNLKNPWKLILSLFLLTISWIYGRLYALILEKTISSEIGNISADRFITYTLIAIACITLIRMIFPGYMPIKDLVPNYFPLSRLQRYTHSVFNDFLTPYFLYLTIFCISGCYYASYQDIYFLFSGLLVLIGAHLLRRCLQYWIDYKLSGKVQPLLLIIPLLLFVTYHFYHLKVIRDFGLLLSVILFFLLGFVLNISKVEPKTGVVIRFFGSNNIFLKLLLNNKQVRLALIVGLVFKFVFLTFDVIVFRLKGKHITHELILLVFSSPLMIFTYVFNNTWGFWKNVCMAFALRTGEYKAMTRFALRILLTPLIIDAAFSIPVVYLLWSKSAWGVIFYISSACFLILASFFWSLETPKKIASTFQMKGSSSPFGVIIASGGVLLLTTIRLNFWFYAVIPVILLMGIIAYWYSVDDYKMKKYRLLEKIIKE